uniref:NADH-ubiquinone oxidoreductase chain 4L n=1 Tax=Spinolyprops cribricollis TaxID=2984372 RepID=A0A978AXC1_9CUCU|nr:NADH dehydrogenase subunit 4L [Spinolyprops cribricollis]UYB79065.1 NADH dehydrogenase subunit 4L [Spinolyprops cribricollis]
MFLSILLSFFMGVLSFSLNRKHLLLMLLSLEFIVLSVFLLMYLLMSSLVGEMYFTMIFLTFSVCEGVLGLSLMILMIRSHGSDYFNSFNLLW